MKKRPESIGRLISILYRAGQRQIGKQLEPHGIGSGQFTFLAELYRRDGVSQDELAASFLCDKATATRALQRLESQGYVVRKRSPDDGRVKQVFLTPKAREFQETLVEVLSGWTETLAKGLSAAERRQAIDLLSRLVDNISDIR